MYEVCSIIRRSSPLNQLIISIRFVKMLLLMEYAIWKWGSLQFFMFKKDSHSVLLWKRLFRYDLLFLKLSNRTRSECLTDNKYIIYPIIGSNHGRIQLEYYRYVNVSCRSENNSKYYPIHIYSTYYCLRYETITRKCDERPCWDCLEIQVKTEWWIL